MISTVSPGFARATAAAMAAARSSKTWTSPRSCSRHLGGAREHRGEDGQGVLGAGVVGGEDGGVGEPGHGRAHRHPLGPVPVAAAAEHHVQLALGHLAQGAQDRLDGVRLVGVVDDGEVRLALVDPLQTARDARYGGDAVRGGLRVDPRDGEGDDRGEGVRHVERAA